MLVVDDESDALGVRLAPLTVLTTAIFAPEIYLQPDPKC